jgi:hypothetical protein
VYVVGSTGITQELDDVGIQYLPIGVSSSIIPDFCQSVLCDWIKEAIMASKKEKKLKKFLFFFYVGKEEASIVFKNFFMEVQKQLQGNLLQNFEFDSPANVPIRDRKNLGLVLYSEKILEVRSTKLFNVFASLRRAKPQTLLVGFF